jgi:hypothetical protein
MSSDEEVEYLGNTRGPSLHYELRAVVEDEEQLDLLYEEGSLLHMMKTQRTRGSTTHLYCAHRANGCKFTAKLMYEDSSLQCSVNPELLERWVPSTYDFFLAWALIGFWHVSLLFLIRNHFFKKNRCFFFGMGIHYDLVGMSINWHAH